MRAGRGIRHTQPSLADLSTVTGAILQPVSRIRRITGASQGIHPYACPASSPCGVSIQRQGCDQGRFVGGGLAVMAVRTLAFVIVRRVLGLVGLGSTPDAKDIEIARAAALVDGGATAGSPTALYAGGSPCVGDVGAAAATRTLAGLPGQAATLLRWHRNWWPVAGPTDTRVERGKDWTPRPSTWWCGWRGRTRGADTSGSWGSAASSAVGTTRYRYRGTAIPSPWPIAE
jgi:hypothetical protein